MRLLQVGQGILGAVDRTPEVDVHQAVQDVEVDVVEERAHRDAGVADHDVDAAEVLDGGVDEPLAVLGAGDVGRAPCGAASGLLDAAAQGLELVGVACAENNFRPHRGVNLGHGLAYARQRLP